MNRSIAHAARRLSPLTVVGALSVALTPSLSSAQRHDCAPPWGTSCDAEIRDAYRRSSSPAPMVVTTESALTILPTACPEPTPILDVDLEVDIVHSHVGDLSIDLVHPDGTTLRMLHRQGLGPLEPPCASDDLHVIFDDEGTAAFDVCSPLIPALDGRVLPWSPFSSLQGRPRAGTWLLRVTDHEPGGRGVLRGWSLHLPCSLDLPTVEIEAIDSLVREGVPGDTATLRVSRTGDTFDELEVEYVVTGTASRDDFEPLSGVVTLPSQSSTALIEIRAVEDALEELDETVIVTLVPTSRYEVGPRDSAQVTIRDRLLEDEVDAGPVSGDAGEEPRVDAGTGDDTDAGSDPDDTAPDEGCGCQATHAPGRAGASASLAALLLLAYAVGRRRARGLRS